MTDPMTVLLTGAGGAACRNVIASLRLSDRGYRIVGVDVDGTFLSASGADATALVPRCDHPAYIDRLRALVAEHGAICLHTQPDVEVQAVAAVTSSDALPHGLPPAAVVERATDKLATAEVLAARDIPVPRSIAADGDLAAAFGELADAGEGVVWLRAIRGAGSRASLPVRSAPEAAAWIGYWQHRGLSADDFMLAQYLPGREFAVQTLFWNGELIASQGRERLAYLFGYLTPSGTTSSPSVAAICNRSDLYATAHYAVRTLMPEPHGVFSVDLKCDADGTPRVTEINAGRFFTTSQFLATVGANFPDLLVRLVAGEDVDPLGVAPVSEGAGYWIRSVDMPAMLVTQSRPALVMAEEATGP